MKHFLLAILLAMTGCRALPPPETFGQVPPFRMTAVTAAVTFPVTRDALKGNPWVANFMFTHCAGPCPLMSATMAGLQKRLPSHVRFVSFTIDPERDTVDILQTYAQTFKADSKRWWFLRGTPDTVHSLAIKGFGLGVEKNPQAPSGLRFTHSTKFVLVDSSGTVRGFYDSQDPGLATILNRDLQKI